LEIFAILIGLVILAATAFYVGRPLMQSRRTVKSDGVDALSLEAQRESLYTQIRELDLDHATGKVNEEDYTRLRADLVAQAAVVLKQIDGVMQPPALAPMKVAAPAASSAGDDLEALIAARRKTRSVSAPKAVDADVEAAIAARRKTAAPVSGELTCPQCGKPISAEDAFCAKCGTALQTQAAH
jgi:hypothetical protein